MTALAPARYNLAAMDETPLPARHEDAGDDDLFRRWRDRRDEPALEALLSRHWPRIYRIAWRILRDPMLAEDAAQRTFAKVAAETWRFRDERFAGWLTRIAVNEARDAAKARRRRARHEEAAGMARAAGRGRGDGGDDLAALEEHLARLDDELRVPLVLRYAEGLTHDEVAAALGIPAGTASSRLRRGLERLRESLTAAGFATMLPDTERLLRELSAGPRAPSAPSLAATLSRARLLRRTRMLRPLGGAVAAVAVVAAVTISGIGRSSGPREPRLGASPAGIVAGAAGRRLADRASSGNDAAREQGGASGGAPSSGPLPSSSKGSGETAERNGKDVAAAPRRLITRAVDLAGKPISGAVISARITDPGEGREAGGDDEVARAVRAESALELASEVFPSDCTRTASDGLAALRIGVGPGGSNDVWLFDVPGVGKPVPDRPAAGATLLLAARRGLREGVVELPVAGLPSKEPLAVVLRAPEVSLPHRGAIVARVRGDAPLANAPVRIHSHMHLPSVRLGVKRAGTDEDGRIGLSGLPADRYDVSIGCAGFAWATFPALEVRAGAVTAIDAGLTPEAVIAGRVVGPDGVPVAEASVAAASEIGSSSARTDRSGRYRLERLMPGTYELVALGPHSFSAARMPHVHADGPGLHEVADLVLARGATVRLRVLDPGGRPMAGASGRLAGEGVSAVDRVLWAAYNRALDLGLESLPGSESTRSDDGGRFELAGVAPGRYTLTIDAVGSSAGSVPLEVPGDRDDVDLGDVRLAVREDAESTPPVGAPPQQPERAARGGAISGRIDAPPQARSKLKVYVVPVDAPGKQLEVTIDPIGRFRAAGLTPGTYRVAAAIVAPRAANEPSGISAGFKVSDPVEVAADGEAGPVILSFSAGRRIACRVRGIGGVFGLESHPSALLVERPFGARQVPLGVATIDPGDGTFAFADAPPTRLAVVVEIAGTSGSATKVSLFAEVDAGADAPPEVVLGAPPLGDRGAISGSLAPAGGSMRIVAVADHLFATGMTAADGSFCLDGLPAGKYRVCALAPAAAVSPEDLARAVDVRVDAGARAQVHLTPSR